MSTFLLGGETEICRIGLGTNRLEEDDESRAILTAAEDLGINLIDTADIYQSGASERVIGTILATDPRALIATKGGYFGAEPEKISRSIEESRKRLQKDTIDLYYLHKPHPETAIEFSVDPIISAKQDGRVGHIGLSNVTLDQIDRVRKLTPVAAVQNVYNCENTENEDVIDYCERHSIAFVPYFPLRGSARAQALADRLGVTRHQAVLAALLARSPVVIPIPGTRSPAHLEANLAAQEIAIDQAALGELGFGSRQ